MIDMIMFGNQGIFQKILDLCLLHQGHLECMVFISHSNGGVKRNNMKEKMPYQGR